ncbi:tRNA-dependent cyclodipeptide synthase [Actinocrispum sp. NPDC049592]|uniref:tRNA-dependent cyclodipeptide synthase n=1 Tax=Actinocrispum sp. NPDC049592 TaxID=3154835 RepID=UPI00341484CB
MAWSGETSLNPVIRRGPFTVQPFSEESRLIWERREHVVFGVSPGNSYFQVGRMTELFGWLSRQFERIDVVMPDSALVHTYLALGYDQQRARKKAHSEINVLRNRVTRAWNSIGGPRTADGLHRMSELSSHVVYTAKLAECEQAVAQDETLGQTCVEMTKEVLRARGHEGPLTAAQIDQAMRYLIAELPFFLASSDIFEVPTSLNFYHRELPLAEVIFTGETLLQASPRQAYATIRPAR